MIEGGELTKQFARVLSAVASEDAHEYLERRIEEARTEREMLELLADALIATILVDDDELPVSRRVDLRIGARAEVEALLADDDIRAVKPRRSPKHS